MLTAETQSLKMNQRIWKMKLMLARSLGQKDGSLAGSIYKEQLRMGWPGLATEVEEICHKIGLGNINEMEVTKAEICDAIEMHGYKEMKEEMEGKEKLKDIRHGNFRKPQEYMEEKSIENARMAYRVRSKMVETIKLNFKNSYKPLLQCDFCSSGEEESQEHAMICEAWEEERRGLDLYRMSDVVKFFTKILKEKGKRRKEERESML